MKRLRHWSKVACVAATAALFVQLAVAQKVANTGPKYDVGSEVKMKGTVEEVREIPGDFQGTHLVVKTDTGTVLVRLAPADFLKEIDTAIKPGDQIEVVGSKAPDSTEPVIMAREITVGTNTTTLRDDKGVPVWAGWKRSKTSGN